jgi:hypothetical protein
MQGKSRQSDRKGRRRAEEEEEEELEQSKEQLRVKVQLLLKVGRQLLIKRRRGGTVQRTAAFQSPAAAEGRITVICCLVPVPRVTGSSFECRNNRNSPRTAAC